MTHSKPTDHRPIRILPGSIAVRALVGTLAAIAKGDWDGKSRIAPLKKSKKGK